MKPSSNDRYIHPADYPDASPFADKFVDAGLVAGSVRSRLVSPADGIETTYEFSVGPTDRPATVLRRVEKVLRSVGFSKQRSRARNRKPGMSWWQAGQGFSDPSVRYIGSIHLNQRADGSMSVSHYISG